MTNSLVSGPDLKALREKAGVTQERIAARVGWAGGRSVVSGQEGRAAVTDRMAVRYLVALVEAMVSRDSVSRHM